MYNTKERTTPQIVFLYLKFIYYCTRLWNVNLWKRMQQNQQFTSDTGASA